MTPMLQNSGKDGTYLEFNIDNHRDRIYGRKRATCFLFLCILNACISRGIESFTGVLQGTTYVFCTNTCIC